MTGVIFFLTKQISKNDLDKNENSSEKKLFQTYNFAQVQCINMFDIRVQKGGCYAFNELLRHESDTEMQTCNLVTEQWSERFMAGY